jgi:predicted P-loop ATPase
MAASTIRISYYNSIKDTKGREIDINLFLHDIREGKWQDLVIPARAALLNAPDKAAKNAIKAPLPNVCLSGVFSERKDAQIKQHSGFIAIDIDGLGVQLEGVRGILRQDPYCYSAFTSVSGTGLCAVFQIEGNKHRDAFAALAHYLYTNYQLIVDQAAKNESRARYVSYDPELFINEHALKFKKYLPKEKPKKISKVVYVKSDFDAIINSLSSKNVCEDYNSWVSIGYALASHFGEDGRGYYHALSSSASSYSAEDCDKQYSIILNTHSTSKQKVSSIASIYYLAKLNGIETYSERTKQILSSTTILRKSGLDQTGVISNLDKFEGIPASESQEIVKQAFDQNISHDGEDSIITMVENWLKYNHDLKRNVITRKIENHGKSYKETDINTLFLSCKKAFDDINFDLFIKILFSDCISEYNPLIEFFERYKERKPIGVIDEFWSCFSTRGGVGLSYFGSKWLIGIISAIHGEHSPLMLVFTGGQNTGKTEAFRRLLPAELRQYYAESKLDQGKDDDILMTQKIIIMDDEMGGKNKQESKKLKEMLSKQTFSLRVPYGKGNEDLNRLAVLCGTSNENSILNDPTGNRRIIPVEIVSVDHKKYNAVDKVDLIMEAYWLYKSGFNWQLSKEDILELNTKTESFVDYSPEYEHIQRYLLLPIDGQPSFEWSATEIKSYLERLTLQKLSIRKLGMELKQMGFDCSIKKINGKAARVYRILTSASLQHSGDMF